MPRVSRAVAQLHREAITDASARLFKERGPKAVSVAELMGAAGLTHGGFYGHFESKDALAGAAIGRAFEQAAQRWQKRIAGKAGAAGRRTALVEAYLAPRSVREVGGGCPTVALAGDVAREAPDAPMRAAYGHGLETLVDLLAGVEARVEDGSDADAHRRAALADYALMAGALMLARATAGTPLSEQFLAAARERLLAPAPRRPPRAARGA